MQQPDFIQVQADDFAVEAEYQALIEHNCTDGAVVTFVGRVRDFNVQTPVTALELEHYPAMTAKVLEDIVEQARERWSLGRVRLIHRVGQLSLGDQIVFVGVTTPHRGDAFAATEFIVDFLKTQAPFWKKETTAEGKRWVQPRSADVAKAKQW